MPKIVLFLMSNPWPNQIQLAWFSLRFYSEKQKVTKIIRVSLFLFSKCDF